LYRTRWKSKGYNPQVATRLWPKPVRYAPTSRIASSATAGRSRFQPKCVETELAMWFFTVSRWDALTSAVPCGHPQASTALGLRCTNPATRVRRCCLKCLVSSCCPSFAVATRKLKVIATSAAYDTSDVPSGVISDGFYPKANRAPPNCCISSKKCSRRRQATLQRLPRSGYRATAGTVGGFAAEKGRVESLILEINGKRFSSRNDGVEHCERSSG
jgi:hypothetical protein